MSTTTPEASPPTPSVAPAGPPIETAPSATLTQGPSFARGVAFVGLFLFVLGMMVVVSTRALGPRWVPEGAGFMLTALGLALMLYHAASDGQQDIRRTYGGFAVLWLIAALVFALIPGPFDSETKTIGHYLLPWGAGFGLIGLMFLVPFCRHETDEGYRYVAVTALLVIGGTLAVGGIAAGIFKPEYLAGPGLGVALLGLAFLCAYFSQVDTSDGIGFTVAFSLGAFGAGVVVYTIFRSAFPTLLFEGPAVLRNPNGSLDTWKAMFRVLGGVVFLAPVGIAFLVKAPGWMKAVTGAIGLAGAGVVLVSMFTAPVHTPPQPFLVPGGLILILLGLIYLSVSLGICSDNQFVTLARRELSAYFLSPIGYFVLAGMVLLQWLGYLGFVNNLMVGQAPPGSRVTLQPIVRHYFFDFIPIVAGLLLPAALTMRLMSEEKRTGSLEVLLTAPVNEWSVTLSKFVATWLFFVLCWLPSALFLVALRVEIGQPFDYLPLMSFYVCLAAQGLAFVGMGLFFSTITKNQIVAAVLTFVGMIFFLLCYMIRNGDITLGLPPFARTALGRLSYIHMWGSALGGRLPLRDVLLFSSLGAFWVFLSVKVLETRKWS